MKNIVAIVGKPNVGKSSLFNKLVGKRVSIVLDKPGVTRDRIYGEYIWNKKNINVIDTGGIEIENTPFQEQIKIQVEIAIEEAELILFLVDGKSEMTREDFMIFQMLQKSNKKFLVVANKLDNDQYVDPSIWKFGKDIFEISAIHGKGLGDLMDKIAENFPIDIPEKEQYTKLVLLGRTNVGKSSLLNTLTSSNRAIVSQEKNTTRDPINEKIIIQDQTFTLIDTAGINRKSKISESVDFYSLVRSEKMLEEADIVLLMMDAKEKITNFDATIIGYADELSKPLILVMNKWDIVEKNDKTMNKMTKEIKDRFPFADWAPIVFISALQKTNLNKLGSTILMIQENMRKKIKTSEFNNFLLEIQTLKPASFYKGGQLNMVFGRQIEGHVPTFLIFVNNDKFLHFSYERFVKNQIREYYGFEGVPIKIWFKNKK